MIDVTAIGNLSNEVTTGLARIQSLQSQFVAQPNTTIASTAPAPAITSVVWYKMPLVWVIVAIVAILGIIAYK